MSDGAVVAAGLASGAAFVVLFSLVFNGSSFAPEKPPYATIVIPEGASLISLEKTYEPDYARVLIGTNNTVRWVNNDRAFHTIAADTSFPRDFDATMLGPGDSYEYTFTTPGMYGYHGEPGPHLRGLIEVYPELEKDLHVDLSVEGMKPSYRVGEPVTFTIVAEGYGARCNRFEARIEDKDAPDFGYSIGQIPGCTLPESFSDFKEQIRVGPESQVFSPAYIHKTGTYLLTVSYELVQFPQVRDSVEIEFQVVD